MDRGCGGWGRLPPVPPGPRASFSPRLLHWGLGPAPRSQLTFHLFLSYWEGISGHPFASDSFGILFVPKRRQGTVSLPGRVWPC